MSTYTGTASNDSINGGAGDDQISALGGNDVVNGNGGSDSINGGDGDDQLRGGFGNASSPPAGQIDGADVLYGGAGNDVLRGQDGDDQLFGGSGDDNLRGDLGNDLLDGGDGLDFAAYRFDDIDAVAGVIFDASVVNSAPTVSLGDGRGGTDTLISIERVIVTGTALNDTITTTTGADQITTVGGDDLVDAGAGDDVIIDYNGSSTLNGGDGDDRFDMVANGYFGGAGAGFDTLNGGAGNDLVQLFWGGVSSDVTVNLTNGSLSAFTADASLSIAGANIERVVVFSGSGNDNLTGGDANDVLSGGAGNDTLNGGDGDDQLEGGAGNDTMDGGAGFDRYLLRLADQFAAGTVDASAFNVSGGVTTVSDGQGGTDTIANIEGVALSGGNFNDTLIGSAGGDTLNGGYGGDTIHGGDGDDLIIQNTLGTNFPTQPGVGQIAVTETADAINGGDGFDTVSYATVSSDMQVNLGLGTVSNNSTGNDTLVSIEGLITGSGADSIVGSGGADRIESGAGDDFVQGLGGDDTILGGDGNDVLNGDGGFGTGAIGGNDIIDGGSGDDVIRGGAGVDQINGGEGNDRITFYMANATQGVVADLRNQTISNDGFGNVETMNSIEGLGGGTRFADTFYGNEGDNTIFGGAGDTVETFGGNDLVLLDAAGALVDGGAGTDTLIFGSARLIDLNGDGVADQEERTAGVSISLATSRLNADGYGGSGDVFGFENLEGTTFADVLDGDDHANQIGGLDGNDVLTGNGGDDTLNGGAGDDQLYGGVGNDLLDGGAGADLMVGGAGDDVYVIDQAGGPGLAGDGVIEVAGEGVDEIRTFIDWGLGGIPDVENLTALGTANIFLGGNDSDNLLTGNAGNNYIVGEGGDDTIDGGGNAADGVNSGKDVASYQLAAGAVGDVVIVEGTGADAGKLLVQLVDGASVQTFLKITPNGPGGAVVEGVGIGAYMGVDTVTNIEELHIFVRTSDGSPTPPNQFVAVNLAANQFGDFLAGSESADTLNLADYPGVINANGNRGDDVITGTDANNGLQGGAGNDTLSGLGGDDNLNGDDGEDVLEGGSENDYMRGGAGDDTIDGGTGTNDIAAFNLPAGTPGSYRVVDGVGANAGKLLVERVDGATVETVFIVTLDGGQATVQGVGLAAHLGTDTVTNVDELHFLPDGPFDPSQFVSISLSTRQFGNFVAGSEAADTIDLANYPGAINANGNRGDDVITGTAVNNSLQGGAGDDVLSGLEGNDFLNGGNGTDTLFGDAGNDTLVGAADGDILNGGDGDDVLIGAFNTGFGPQPGDGADVLRGEGGNDVIRGGDGDDLLEGGDGNDNLRGDAGSDTLDGGAGEDFASYFFTALNSGITFDARAVGASATSTIIDPSGGVDTLVSIEKIGIGGTNFDDVLYGSEHLNPATGYANQMSGNAGDDQLYGGVGNDLLDGGAGADLMVGGAGDDVYVIDQAGGPGLAGDGVIEVAGEGIDEIRTFIDWGLGGIPDVENLTALGTANIFLGGNDSDNLLTGNAGNNYIVGEGGDDTIDGGGNAADGVNSGKDVASYQLAAGAVGDVVIVEGTGAEAGKLLVQLVDGASVQTFLKITPNGPGGAVVEGVGIGAYMGVDTVTNIEELHIFVRTSDGSPTPPNQFVAVNLAANQFGDFLAGSESADTLNLADYPGVINANGNRGDDVITGTDANNGLQGGAGNDTLSGLGGDDNLNGDDGEDVLEGGSENDYMRGGAGDDTIDGGTGTNDIAAFNLPAGTPGSYRVVDGVGANAGKLLVERVDGATVETVFIVTLDGGQATIQGVGLAAHLGTDTVTNVDELHFLPDGPFDPSQFVSISLSTRQFGNFVAGSEAADTIDLANYPGAINANGNRGDDVITGTAVNNSLQGGAGDDVLSGLEGNDFLNGGNGTDTLFGDAGNDTLVGAADGDILNGGDGDDVLIGAFNTGFGSQPGDGADVLRGEGGNDVIRGGDGDDLLEGGDGNDNLRGDAGSDTLDGGAGEDFASYFFTALNSGITFDARAVGASATSTIIDPSGGVDTLVSIEKIGIGGTNFDDVLYGSEHLNPATGYANQMSGNAGDDQLYGGVGNDLLDGGTGADVLAGAGGSDTLIGGTGDDTLNGGDGDDFLVGDFGDDQIDGGAGALDRGFFYLDPATSGTLSVQVGSGEDAGKLLVIRTDGTFVETIAEVTAVGGQTIVTGVGSAAYLGVDTLSNVERLVFSILPPDPLQNPTMPGYAVIEVGATEGVVADGYVAGATVFVDNDRNGVFDAGEASAVTDADGKFQLVTFGGGPILAIGGTNTDTGLANTVVLSAPSGSTVINPLTTLVQAVVDAGGLSVAAAQAQVTTALGLDPNISLLTTDLLASAAAGDPAALEAQKAAAIIVTLLEAATDAAGGATGAEAAALAQIAAIIEAAPTGGVDLTNSATIEAVLEAAAPGAGDLGSAAAVLSATTTAIANAANLGDLANQQAAAMLTGNDLDNELVSGARGDQLTGAGGNDTLRGNGGDDTLLGGSGDDVLIGGDGFDRLYGGTGNDRFVIEGGTPLAGSKGNLAFDVIFDFDQTNDLLDFGSADLIDVRTYGNVNAAESSLGVELDGLAKQAKPKQFVTVAFGDSDGDGIADFAVAMIGVKSIGHDQIRFGQPAPDALASTSAASSSGSRELDAEVSGDVFVSLPDGETAFAFRMDDAFETFGTNNRKATFGGGHDPYWALTSAPSPDGQPGDALFGPPGPAADPWA